MASSMGHRAMRFERVADAQAEVDRLVAAGEGVRTSGTWTLGQALGHLAAWAEYSYTGAPLRVPAVVRWVVRLGKRRFLYKPMRAGGRIPRVPGGTLATEVRPLDVALPRFRAAFARLDAEAPTGPHVLFGRMTQAEWIAMHMRHAELHLGFFDIG